MKKWRLRLWGLLSATTTGTVIYTATQLTPDPSGMGTHTQLGLAGCVVLEQTGWPCPMCGMTTSFSHFVHLEPLQAILNQPFSLILFALTLLLFVQGIREVVLPVGRLSSLMRWVGSHELVLSLFMLAGLLIGWWVRVMQI